MPSVSIPATPAKSCQGYPDNNLQNSTCQVKSDFSYKNHKRNYVFRVFPNFVEFVPGKTSNYHPAYVCSKRNPIYSFSGRARFRLFSTLAKMKERPKLTPLFLTLTYHYGHVNSEQTHREHLHTFLTRVRKYDPAVQYIWRLEYQKRKAPHFHLILFPGFLSYKKSADQYVIELSRIWHKIADPTSKAHLKYGFISEKLYNYRKACAYLSKYLAKVDDYVYESSIGKQWGCSRNLPFHEKKVLSCTARDADYIIERIRLWMFRSGREKYASFIYFRSDRPQGIFIADHEFYLLLIDLKNEGFSFEFS